MLSELITNCANGGEIHVAQTTFVELVGNRKDGMSRFRIHYVGKREVNIKPGKFKTLHILEDHPLLLQYVETNETIYLGSKVKEKQKFISLLEDAAVEHFEGWRTLYSYVNPWFANRLEEFLDGGFGILIEAPRSFAQKVISIAKSVGVDLHTRPGNVSNRPLQLLLMDKYFTIAAGFRVDKLEERSTSL